jgi:hypothetical protein
LAIGALSRFFKPICYAFFVKAVKAGYNQHKISLLIFNHANIAGFVVFLELVGFSKLYFRKIIHLNIKDFVQFFLPPTATFIIVFPPLLVPGSGSVSAFVTEVDPTHFN